MDTQYNFLETIDYDKETHTLVILDQTKLPNRTEYCKLTTAKEVWDAIYLLKVRGAPAIGVAAAFAVAMLAWKSTVSEITEFVDTLYRDMEYLNSSRPTAVNLKWALDRMKQCCETFVSELNDAEDSKSTSGKDNIQLLKERLLELAFAMKEEDIHVCKSIGMHGATLLSSDMGILTHCNAGSLATCRYGTALAPVYVGQEKGYRLHVYADETRPLLQGARLTAFELSSAGIPVTLACDSMVSSLMAEGKIQAVFVGCDRVAANGDVANKIGTSTVAITANYYQIPFYVCAPLSTVDDKVATGTDIVIEHRPGEEVTSMWYQDKMAPDGISVYNPAFDVTKAELVTAYITEKGVFYTPHELLQAKKEENSGR